MQLWVYECAAVGKIAGPAISLLPCCPQVLSFPITIWPMREDIIEMLAHSFGSSTQLSPTAYYLLTYSSLLAIYLVAVVIQSAYSVGWLGLSFVFLLSLVGWGRWVWAGGGRAWT